MIVVSRLSCQYLRRIRRIEIFRSEYFSPQRVKSGITTKCIDFRVDVKKTKSDGTLVHCAVELSESTIAHSEGAVQQRHVVSVRVFGFTRLLDLRQAAQSRFLPAAFTKTGALQSSQPGETRQHRACGA